MSLFPRTAGGRYYTINIGSHEVAFSTLDVDGERPWHMLYMDRLIRDFRGVVRWVKRRSGQFSDNRYATALPRSTAVIFRGDFATALEFMELPGVRRALTAYWSEALIGLGERESRSVHSRHHDWNAVAELKRRIDTRRSGVGW